MKRIIDAQIWRTGHSLVITLPTPIIKKFKLKKGDLIEVTLKL